MGHGKDGYFQEPLSIDDSEWKLPESVFAEVAEVGGPALRSLPDSFDCLPDDNRKLFCGDWTLIPVPGQRCQIFLLRCGVETERLTFHRGARALFAELTPKRRFSPGPLELRASGD